MKKNLSLLLFFTFVNLFAQNKQLNYFPQAFFNKSEASKMLENGKAKIKGVAFTREASNASSAKHYGKNTIVMLFPVTEYLLEWQKLVNKSVTDPNANVTMSEEAFKYRIETLTDEFGNFSFPNMKPGKYFIQCDIDFVGVASDYQKTGTLYYSNGAVTDTYEKYFYNYNGRHRHNLMVEIESDGQLKEVKLKPRIFQNYKNIGSKFVSTQNCYLKNNLQFGKCSEYYESGKLKVISEWKDGMQNGDTEFFYENGKTQAVGKYKKDSKVGIWKYFNEDGILKSDESYVYKDGKSVKEGKSNFYYLSGKINMIDNYVNNLIQGEGLEYYESGKLKSKVYFKDSLIEGNAFYYDENGMLTRTITFKNGKQVQNNK